MTAPPFKPCACGHVAMTSRDGGPWRCFGCGALK
jgi:hypothetical protein